MTDFLKRSPLDARDETLSELEPLELVRSHMPKWLLKATPEMIKTLNASMAQSRAYHALSGQKFAQLEGIEAYCAPLLAAELKRRYGVVLNIFRDQLEVAHVHVVTDDTLLGTVRYRTDLDEPKTLLWAALQNFSESQAVPGGFDPQSKIRLAGLPGRASPIRPDQFAALCRELNLGLKYQNYLQQFLGVAATGSVNTSEVEQETESNLRLLKRYDMEVDAQIAYLKNHISDTARTALLALLAQAENPAPAAQAKLDGKPLVQSSLSILDTVIDGVVVFSADTPLLHPTDRLIIYIPNDPVSPFFEFSSLQVLIDELKVRFRRSEYVSYFSGFVALSARPVFLQKINANPVKLSLTTATLGMSAAHYLCVVQLKNMFADAQLLAVPTGVLDAQEREQRWQLFKNAGLFIVNVASLFVPVLGAVMLAVAVGEMLSEVYEGVDDWLHGDVDHAREHLLNVALDIVTAAAIVTGTIILKKATSGLSQATKEFFGNFEPITREDGTARLWDKKLEPYSSADEAQHRQYMSDAQGIFKAHGKHHVTVQGKHYAVERDPEKQHWRIIHPRSANAFKPGLVHNRQGAWQFAHERPLEWEGSAQLIGRLGTGPASLDETTLEQVRALTDTPNAVMRRVHLENLPAPPLLNVSLKRFEIDRKIDGFIEAMKTSRFKAAQWADLQLSLLPDLVGWPEDTGLVLLDGAGHSNLEYNATLSVVTSRISITPTDLAQGKVLDAVLRGLPKQRLSAILGAEVSLTPLPVATLANRLGQLASDRRASVFEKLYERFNVARSPETRPIEKAFTGLPRPVAQALVDSATDVERASLRHAKVPLLLAEHAREYVREGRLNRAFEGFFLRTQLNPDTERLTRHFIAKMANWPATTTIELRDGSTWGNVVQRWGTGTLKSPCVIVKTEGGYQRYRLQGEQYVLEPGSESLLSTALFKSLTNDQRQRLGFAMIDQAADFNASLANLASADRAESARILGMQPIKPAFKPPLRISDGKLGYPLCGLDTGDVSRSMRRRVLDLYPGFDDEQIQDYLASITETGLDPLTYLRGRKRQRKLLRQTLQSWVDESPTEISTSRELYNYPDSRYQAAVLIQRSWHKNTTYMPWVSPEQASSLSLDGLRVGHLPMLPSEIDFSHITHLNINNMECGESVSGFLERFNNLTLLHMDHNRIRSLPTQLQNMPFLRQLSVANNFLYVSPADNALLGSLRNLEVLNLNGNLLGPLLDLNTLPYLRRVYLRRTAIQDWPSGLVLRPLLEIADLRENRLLDIPELVYQAPASVTRNISLSGNPLIASSRLRLARFVAQGGSSLGINSEALISEAAAFDFWTAGITSHELARREELWFALKADPASEDFFTVISRLTTTAEAQSVRQDLSRRVWEMIEAATQNQTLRFDLLDMAASPRSCTDSVTMVFSGLEIIMILARLNADSAASESDLLRLAVGLFRLDKVGKIAEDECAARLALSGKAADEVEVHLAYRIGLAQALDLPGQPRHMTFKLIADVSQADLDKARIQVELAEKTSEVSQFVSRTEFWREHLNRTFSSEFAQLTLPYFEQLNDLLRRSPEMTSERYLRRVNDIRTAMDVVVDAWSLTKTAAVLPTPLPGGAHG